MGQKMDIYFISKSSYQQTFMIPFKKTTPQFHQFQLFGTFDEFYLKDFVYIVYYAKYLLKIAVLSGLNPEKCTG